MLSRRNFLASPGIAMPARAFSAAGPEAISIKAGEGAGPAPAGAPVETSVPFARGERRDASALAVFTAAGKPVLTETRVAMRWPDGSIRWLGVTFEPEAGPGEYQLRAGSAPQAEDLVSETGGTLTLDTGESVFRFSRGWLESLGGAAGFELTVTRWDGVRFRASEGSPSATVEERGPLKATIRLDAKALFDVIVRLTAYRGRPEALLSIAWINATGNLSEQVRDIRAAFPFRFTPSRLVFGCERGVYDGPYLEDWPLHILQEDHNRYWARHRNPDGRLQRVSSGGCDGERCPGWLYLDGKERRLGIWVPRFHEEYPSEIALEAGELSAGLWPERAAPHLMTRPLLPANPDGERPYVKTKYWPVLPHPYVAFLDSEKKSLDARQGMAKTQEIVVCPTAGGGAPALFEKKWWRGSLAPVRGHVDPAAVGASAATGPLVARGKAAGGDFDALFDEAFHCLTAQAVELKCIGKFDYGDFRYFTAATDYMCHPGTKWGAMGEMPREGYWHNNECDTLLGLLLYYLRTAEPAAWERSRALARHLLDVDIRHHPHWGMYTHSYGHCYVETAPAGEPDHSWLLGLLVWAGAAADPLAWDWALRCGEELTRFRRDFTRSDARTVAVHLHMMCQFYGYTGEKRFLEAASAPARAFLAHQNEDGSWPAYMANMERSRAPGFVDHAALALADYFAITGESAVRAAVDRAIEWMRSEPGELEHPLVLHALAVLGETTGERRYADLARQILGHFRERQNRTSNPLARGDIAWAQWGVNNPEAARGTGRPPQLLNQVRPLAVSALLAYGQRSLASIERVER
ncbi:MAG: hypothetical protein KIT09_20180 [Bryobacteraceae bacterium]|nr:hypothetical protein [Bryobacteraceae bacterium]